MSLSLAVCPAVIVSVPGCLFGCHCLCPWLFVRLALSLSLAACPAPMSLSLAACPALLVSVRGCLSGSHVSVRLPLSLSLAVCPAVIVSVPGCLSGCHCLCPWLFVRLALSLSLAPCPALCRNETLNRSKLLRHTMPGDGRPAVADVPQAWAVGLRKETRRRQRLGLAAQRRDEKSGGWRKKGGNEGGTQETLAEKDVRRTPVEQE